MTTGFTLSHEYHLQCSTEGEARQAIPGIVSHLRFLPTPALQPSATDCGMGRTKQRQTLCVRQTGYDIEVPPP